MPHAQLFAGERPKLPLTIVAGDAASGKTSLVRHLVAHSTTCRVCAVVASDARMDPTLIARHDGSRILLHNGNMWVIGEDQGSAALASLADAPIRPDHVICDCSSSSDLRRVSGYGYMPGYSLNGLIFVTDPIHVASAENDSAANWKLQNQAAAADVVVLNKADLVDEPVARRAYATLEEMAPNARVIWAEHGRIAPPLLLGLADTPDTVDGRTVLAEWKPDYKPVVPNRDARGKSVLASRSRTCETHRAWCLVADQAIDGREFRKWVEQLPRGVLSGGGTVYLRGEPEHRHGFRFLGRRWKLERGQPWGTTPPSTRVFLAAVGGGAQ